MSYQPCARVWMFFAKNLFGPESSCECFFPQKCCQIQIFGSPTQHLMHFVYLQNEHFMSLLIASTQNLYGILHFFYITYIRQHTYIYIYINCTYSFCAIYIIYSVPQKEHRKVFFRMLRPERRQENLDPTSWNPTGKHEPHFWKKFRNKNHANMEDSRMHAESTYSWEMLKMKSPNEKLDPIIYTCQVYKEVKDIGKLGENNQALAHRANAFCFVGT